LTQTARLDGQDDETIAWALTDKLVREAQRKFLPAWEKSRGDTGWVSFELDPLLEDTTLNIPVAERTKKYVELSRKWSADQKNRMIKVPQPRLDSRQSKTCAPPV
jgi:transaldolase